MVKRHVNLSFKYVRQGDLAPLATYIVDTMGKNADVYPSPTPSLAEIKKLVDAYMSVLGKSEYAGQTGDIHTARHALEAGLKQLGEYVNGVANGDEGKLERSGFPLSKVPTPHEAVPAPTDMGAELFADGGFLLWATVVDKTYNGVLFAFTEVGNPDKNPYNWTIRYSPNPEFVLKEGLVRGKEYKFAVAFVGSSLELHWGLIGRTLFAS